MQHDKSSNLAASAYDAHDRVLTVEFRGGRVYRYAGVPAETYHQLLTAESAGQFFAREIRGKFAGERVR